MTKPETRGSGVEHVEIGSSLEGQRIDNFLLARVKGVPRSHLYRLLRRGEVRVNKGRVKPSYRLKPGDLVRIPPLRAAAVSVAPGGVARPGGGGRGLRLLASAVLHEDEHLLVVDKPSGMAVHGGSGLSWGLIEAMRTLRPEIGDLELVHRLDRETSGCLLLSKRRGALRELHRLIRDQAVEKKYLALLAGAMDRPEVLVEVPLRKNLLQGGERVVRVDSALGKAASTRFRCLRRFGGNLGDFTLVEAQPLTGRTHQIRVHAAHLGTPVAGDDKYGAGEINRGLRPFGLNRLFLHAASLTFRPTYSERPLHVESPLPAPLAAVLDALAQHNGEKPCVSN